MLVYSYVYQFIGVYKCVLNGGVKYVISLARGHFLIGHTDGDAYLRMFLSCDFETYKSTLFLAFRVTL
jgi:hypothetical protein